MGTQHYQRFVIETSLKPFKKLDPESVAATCERLFTNWERLIERADEACVLLWVGDGSDIYQWHGDWEEEIVWAKYVGFCNYDRPGAYDSSVRHYRVNQAVPYVDDPPLIRFRDLRAIIEGLRAAAERVLARPIRVGATVDPGPEFVHSSFKFVEHPEILTPHGHDLTPMGFYTHQAVLHADDRAYAGLPEGIPEGTSFGTFLGKQFAAAARDFGYDYVWFSNGFGYTHTPWGFRGALFRGEWFDAGKAAAELDKANRFWTDFRRACPDRPIEVRGTNFSVGMDIATSGCSHADIASLGGLDRPPCNPPWGSRALGLEMTSYLSRIAKTRGRRLPFRFYLNDPWFVSNAWYDYYNRETFDIYVPMAAARLDEAGGVDVPTDLALLTVDTHRGELLRDEANEAIPHLLRALDERADAPGPLIWVYPFDEYDAVLKKTPEHLGHLFMHDWFICHSIGAGLPLNTVCSSDRLVVLAHAGRLPEAIYVAPVPVGGWAYGARLLEHVRRGGQVLLYGSLEGAPSALLQALSVTLGEPLEGAFDVDLRLATDRLGRKPRLEGRQDLITANLHLIFRVAERYVMQGLSFPDLIQEGYVGLLRAAELYDSAKGYEFSAYATWWIKQAISRARPKVMDPAFKPLVDLEEVEGAAGGLAEAGVPQPVLYHRPVVDGGGLRALCDQWDDPDLRCVVSQDGQRRVYALTRARPDWQGGRLSWIRGSTSIEPSVPRLEPTTDPPGEAYLPAEWTRRLLADHGLDIVQERPDRTVKPVNVFVKRWRGAWAYLGHKPDTTTRFWVKTVDGAPVYAERETPIVDGYAGESFGKTFYSEVRAFVEMADGVVAYKELPVPLGKHRHFCLSGLVDATVTLYPDPLALQAGSFDVQAQIRDDKTVPHEVDTARGSARVEGHTGELYVLY
jgi:hypothetical protein